MKKQRKSETVKLSFPIVKDKVREFILDQWKDGKILYKKTDEGYIIFHPVYGRLGDLSLEDMGGDTRLAFTKAYLPNGDEARAQGLTIDSMFEGREIENENFYEELLALFPSEGANELQDKWNRLGAITKERYTKAWQHYLDMVNEYEKDQLDEWGGTKPNYENWKSRLVANHLVMQERTLSTIKRFGEAGIIPIPKKRRK